MTRDNMVGTMRTWMRLIALFAVAIGLTAIPAHNAAQAAAAPSFKVLAFYSGTWDAAHINFVQDANKWFPQAAAQNNFSYTSTNNWSLLNASNLQQYQVVLFLDDLPQNAAQRSAFEQYVRNGGGWMGFHVSAFNTDPQSWSWYHNEFLGTGAFKSNTWGPTSVTLRTEGGTHPSTARLPATFTSSISEWYSWNNDLRNNPNIKILGSIDPSSFPVGTDPNQSWRSGYYPIMWTNKNYKMLYANFGHNDMNYSTNTGLSSTFSSEVQNRFVIDGLKWLGGVSTTPTPTPTPTPDPTDPISPTAWYTLVNSGSGKCVDVRAAATTSGAAIQQYACNGTLAQQFQVQPTSGGFARINNRNNGAQSIDVTNVSLADGAPLQQWTYGGGNNQQWQAVSEGGGNYHFVSRLSAKCISVPNASTADSVQLVQRTCDNTAAQSFRLTRQS
ncbi:Ricin-type beta-trefoil lectin domain-like [Streptosporangium subroseum]|uniref:Ricin-type beta-trefoil lectin domain-like n=2 Tax=Streptosporangium subroseum TaxID=106412 RepID=A0A239MNT6_9ACTN|nr:Ricin-type beta-trefoil lectin domain-like [Streptosporangium subroseum]